MSRFRHLRRAAALAVASCAVILAVSPAVARATNWKIQANADPSASQTATFLGDLAARDDRPPKNSRAGSSNAGSR